MALLLKSLPQDSKLTPSSSMKYVNNKNNRVENQLRKQLRQYNRDKVVSISQIDQERLDIHDFMKNLKKCVSDECPESIKLLGPRGRSSCRPKTNKSRKDKHKETLSTKNEDNITEVSSQDAKQPEKISNLNKQAQQLEKARRCSQSVPPLLGSRNYRPPDNNSVTNTELIYSVALENKPRRLKNNYTDTLPDIHNNNNNNQPTTQEAEQEKIRIELDPKGNVSLVRSIATQKDRLMLPKTAPNLSHTGLTPREVFSENQEVMKKVMHDNVKRMRRRRRKRKPLNQRIEEFYSKVETLKVKEVPLTDWEKKRRWVLYTKGIEAALAMSSDEEDNDNLMNTI